MGKKVIDITKPWKRPNPIKGAEGPNDAKIFQGRKAVNYLGKGKVSPGLPWKKPDYRIKVRGDRVSSEKAPRQSK